MEIIKFILRLSVIVIIYFIIIYALKIMYTDTKTAGKKKKKVRRATEALEVLSSGDNTNLKTGSIIPIADSLTVGRKSDNIIVLDDKYTSGYHLRIYRRNNEYVLEDLDSTNGTKVNDLRIKNTVVLKDGDIIKVGTAIFKLM